MKAVVYERYGTPNELVLKEIERPVPKDNEALVKVHAVSINSWDWDMLRGRPYIVRMWGLLKPKYQIPGADIAGRVEAVGKNVAKFQPGDEVFGDLCENGWGGFAEYVCARDDALALKSPRMTFEEAAAIPQAGLMALQSIRDKGETNPGKRVLINGAGGGVGTFAVQIAKTLGAEVTVVDASHKLELLKSIGADHLIDYRKTDFTKNGKLYDLIVDVVARRSVFEYKRTLNPGGIFLMVGGTGSAIIQAMVLGPLISESPKGKRLGILAHKPNKGLDAMNEFFESDKVKPVIDRVFPLDEVADAFTYYGSGRFKGKVVVRCA